GMCHDVSSALIRFNKVKGSRCPKRLSYSISHHSGRNVEAQKYVPTKGFSCSLAKSCFVLSHRNHGADSPPFTRGVIVAPPRPDFRIIHSHLLRSLPHY